MIMVNLPGKTFPKYNYVVHDNHNKYNGVIYYTFPVIRDAIYLHRN